MSKLIFLTVDTFALVIIGEIKAYKYYLFIYENPIQDCDLDTGKSSDK